MDAHVYTPDRYDKLISALDKTVDEMFYTIREIYSSANPQCIKNMEDTFAQMMIERIPLRLLFLIRHKMAEQVGGSNGSI